MTSAINADLPAEVQAYTADVRANFLAAKNEIEALQLQMSTVNILHKVYRKTTDQGVVSSAVLVEDDDLRFDIGASEEWVGRIVLNVGHTLASTGFRCGLASVVGATQTVVATLNPGGLVGLSSVIGGSIIFLAADLAGATDGIAYVDFWIQNGITEGEVRFLFAQGASNFNATILQPGSYMLASRIVGIV